MCWRVGRGLINLELENDMHPYLINKSHIYPALPYARTHRKRDDVDGGTLRQLWRSFVRRRKRNKLMDAFHALDDRLLRDIGILRGEIHSIVHGFDDQELGMVPVAASVSQRLRK